MDSRLPSIRMISIIQHRRQPSGPNKCKENSSPKKQYLNTTFMPKITQFEQIQTGSVLKNKIEPRSRTKKVNCVVEEDPDESKKQSPLVKSFKSENRRNGIHDLNKILV